MASKLAKVIRKKFNKLAALNDDIDVGGHVGMSARRAKSTMNDSWTKRKSNNVAGFYDAGKARAVKRGAA